MDSLGPEDVRRLKARYHDIRKEVIDLSNAVDLQDRKSAVSAIDRIVGAIDHFKKEIAAIGGKGTSFLDGLTGTLKAAEFAKTIVEGYRKARQARDARRWSTLRSNLDWPMWDELSAKTCEPKAEIKTDVKSEGKK